MPNNMMVVKVVTVNIKAYSKNTDYVFKDYFNLDGTLEDDGFYYIGGGGGGGDHHGNGATGVGGNGGKGGGGYGGTYRNNGGNAFGYGSGGGGGAGRGSDPVFQGGKGSDGIIVIRYKSILSDALDGYFKYENNEWKIENKIDYKTLKSTRTQCFNFYSKNKSINYSKNFK